MENIRVINRKLRKEKIDSLKINKTFLKLFNNLDNNKKTYILNLSLKIISNASNYFNGELIDILDWEVWLLNELKTLDLEIYNLLSLKLKKNLNIPTIWMIIGDSKTDIGENINQENPSLDLDMDFLSLPEDSLFDNSNIFETDKKKKNTKTEPYQLELNDWILWISNLSSLLDDEKNELKSNLSLEINKHIKDKFIAKTQKDWYEFFKRLLIKIEKNESLQVLSRRLAYGMMLSPNDNWLEGTSLLKRIIKRFSPIEENGYVEEITHLNDNKISVWSDLVKLSETDNIPVNVIFNFLNETKYYISKKNESLFSNYPKLLKWLNKGIIAITPLLLNNTISEPFENYVYQKRFVLTGDYSDIEKKWNIIGDYLRSFKNVYIKTQYLNEEQWFQMGYYPLILKTINKDVSFEMDIDIKNPYLDKILSPSFSENNWTTTMNENTSYFTKQKILKSISDNKLSLNLHRSKYNKNITLGFNVDNFYKLNLVDREIFFDDLSLINVPIIFNLLNIKNALINHSKEINNNTSFEWFVDRMKYFNEKLISMNDNNVIGFISSKTWDYYESYNIARIDNEEDFKFLSNILTLLNDLKINHITDISITTKTMLNLSILEWSEKINIHNIRYVKKGLF